MAVLTRALPCLALLVGGCTLYFDGEADDVADDDGTGGGGGSGSGGGTGGSGQQLSLPCIHDVAGGDLQTSVADTLLVVYACEGGPIVSSVFRDTALREFEPRADWNTQYRHLEVADLDGAPPHQVLASADDGFGAGVFQFGTRAPGWTSWHRIDLSRRFNDVSAFGREDLVMIWAVAGDNALRIYTVEWSDMDEREVLTGRPFMRVVAADLDDAPGRDLFYIARSNAGAVLGLALSDGATPPAFTDRPLLERLASVDSFDLVTGDVDGDGIDDVVGALPELFVYSSRLRSLDFLGSDAVEIAIGDLDGDGVNEPVYVTADRSAIHRVDVIAGSTDVSLASRPWLNEPSDRLVVADLDGDTHDDIVVLRGRGMPASQLAFFRSP